MAPSRLCLKCQKTEIHCSCVFHIKQLGIAEIMHACMIASVVLQERRVIEYVAVGDFQTAVGFLLASTPEKSIRYYRDALCTLALAVRPPTKHPSTSSLTLPGSTHCLSRARNVASYMFITLHGYFPPCSSEPVLLDMIRVAGNQYRESPDHFYPSAGQQSEPTGCCCGVPSLQSIHMPLHAIMSVVCGCTGGQLAATRGSGGREPRDGLAHTAHPGGQGRCSARCLHRGCAPGSAPAVLCRAAARRRGRPAGSRPLALRGHSDSAHAQRRRVSHSLLSVAWPNLLQLNPLPTIFFAGSSVSIVCWHPLAPTKH